MCECVCEWVYDVCVCACVNFVCYCVCESVRV